MTNGREGFALRQVGPIQPRKHARRPDLPSWARAAGKGCRADRNVRCAEKQLNAPMARRLRSMSLHRRRRSRCACVHRHGTVAANANGGTDARAKRHASCNPLAGALRLRHPVGTWPRRHGRRVQGASEGSQPHGRSQDDRRRRRGESRSAGPLSQRGRGHRSPATAEYYSGLRNRQLLRRAVLCHGVCRRRQSGRTLGRIAATCSGRIPDARGASP